MNDQVHISQQPDQFQSILRLRYKVLREPWQQSMESATDERETEAYNAFILSDTNEVIACGRLQQNEHSNGQIRYMAVLPEQQGKGLGKKILQALEQKALELDLRTIELQARENALDFYLNNGYSLVEKSFLLWNQIQHYKLSKTL